MDRVLAGLPFIFVYLNDILVASPDHASHRHHLREVLRRLRENGLAINPQKSIFGQEEVKFLGHRVSAFCRSLGIQHMMTTAYHPQSNGMLGRMHWHLKAALLAHRSSFSWPSLWIRAFAACTLGGGVCVRLPRRCSSVPHTLVRQGGSPFQHILSPGCW